MKLLRSFDQRTRVLGAVLSLSKAIKTQPEHSKTMADEEESNPNCWGGGIPALKWSRKPGEFLADFLISIKTSGTGDPPMTYYVHKHVLSVGTKGGAYFVKLFREDAEISSMDLRPKAARAFPAMLDFVYSQEDELQISPANTFGLLELGHFFGIPALTKKVLDFCECSISMDLCETWYEDGKDSPAARGAAEQGNNPALLSAPSQHLSWPWPVRSH